MKAISILSAAALLVSSVNAGNDPRECEGEEGVSCIFVEIVQCHHSIWSGSLHPTDYSFTPALSHAKFRTHWK